MPSPVTTALRAEVAAYARQHGLVVWLDREGHFKRFVDEWREPPVPIVALRGSWLELMLAFGDHAGGLDQVPLVVYLPGHNEESIRGTPALEIYEPGKRFRKALPTLITEAATGRATPDAIRRFLDRPGVTLEDADAWLDEQAVAAEGGLRAELARMSTTALLADLLGDRQLDAVVTTDLDQDVLWAHLHRVVGMDAAWRNAAGDPVRDDYAEAGYLLGAWALSVEYVHDLKRPPWTPALRPLRDLPKPLVAECSKLAEWLRRERPEDYARIADECEGLLAEEVENGVPDDLGRIDTFRFEEACVLSAAIAGLAEDRWDEVLGWVRMRDGDRSFWIARDPGRRIAWQLVGEAAALGAAIAAAGRLLDGVSNLEEATERYVQKGAVVDRAHRALEQARTRLLEPHLPHFGDLRDRLDGLRDCWSRWADDVARDFSALCRREGFLPSESHQQRHLFEQVVRPLTQGSDRVALFVVDALRFEMAEELSRELAAEPGTTVTLKPRLAELPTVTEVGMNVLAPVARTGRLAPAVSDDAIAGFRTQEFVVRDPETRRRMMHLRAGGTDCPLLPLAEVLGRSVESLRLAVSRAKLVVVHSTEIDEGGENQLGPAVFDLVLRQLRAAWRLLREAGIRTFVITADHGFLLVDDSEPGAHPFGRRIDPSRRYATYPVPVEQPGLVTVSLSQLGYDDVSGCVLFPEGIKVFDTGRRRGAFVHGGNSLQERVIPVLVVRHRTGAGGSDTRFVVQAAPRQGIAGMHCVAITVALDADQAALPFGGAREVEVALRVPERPEIRVEVCDARNATVRTGAVRARVGDVAEVFFKLVGPREERVRIEVFHPSAAEELPPVTVDARYPVSAAASSAATAGPADPEAWAVAIVDEGARRVFLHLGRHGAITEAEATGMLGSPRAMRRFSSAFDEFAGLVPFRVRVEVTASGKRYVREGDG